MLHNIEDKSNIENNRAASHKGRAIIQTAFWMAVLTLVSKFLGFAREMVMAGFYGTSYVTDAYVMATSVPVIMFGGIFGAVAISYMPVYSRIKENNGDHEGNIFTSQTINLLTLLSIGSAIVGIMLSDQIVDIFASGFQSNAAQLTSFFIKVTFSFIIFTSITGVFNSYLQYRNVFLPQIIVSYTQNILIIIIIIISSFTSFYLLPFGMLIGSGIRLALTAYIAGKHKYQYFMSFAFKKNIKEIFALALPVFIGTYITEINAFVDKTLASGLQEGTVSALNYGMLLVTLITGLTITIITTIAYPKLTYFSTVQDHDKFSKMLGTSLMTAVLIVAPCSLGAMAYSEQIVQIVYERGAFNPAATELTSACFFMYAAGMCFLSINILLIKTFYSLKKMKTPLIMCTIGVAANAIISIILVKPMAHSGIALGTTIGEAINTLLLYISLKKECSFIKIIESPAKLLKILFASVISIASSMLLYNFLIIPLSGIIRVRMVQLFLAVTAAIMVYYILLRLFKIEELKFISNLIKEKIFKKHK